MYNTKYECRYHKDDIFLETDDIDEDGKDYVRNILYREDLLNIFFVSYDEDTNYLDEAIDILDTSISKLYKMLAGSTSLKECMKISAAVLMCEDEIAGLSILYSYDFMYLTHICVSEYFQTGIISDINIRSLKEKIHARISS
jgi:hypothetical protein